MTVWGNQTSWLLHIMLTYLNEDDVAGACVNDKRVPVCLRKCARVVRYQETCPVCKKGVWTYYDKSRLCRNIQNCWEYKDRLCSVPCPNKACERWSIYRYLPYPSETGKIPNLVRFERDGKMYLQKWFRSMDESTRRYFVARCKST